MTDFDALMRAEFGPPRMVKPDPPLRDRCHWVVTSASDTLHYRCLAWAKAGGLCGFHRDAFLNRLHGLDEDDADEPR